MDEHVERLADKFAEVNTRVRTRQKIREAAEELVALGILSYDASTGEFTRLVGDEEGDRILRERGE